MNHYLVLFSPSIPRKKSNNNRLSQTAEEKIIWVAFENPQNQMDFTALQVKPGLFRAGSVDMEKVQMLQYVSPKTETLRLQ